MPVVKSPRSDHGLERVTAKFWGTGLGLGREAWAWSETTRVYDLQSSSDRDFAKTRPGLRACKAHRKPIFDIRVNVFQSCNESYNWMVAMNYYWYSDFQLSHPEPPQLSEQLNAQPLFGA